MRLAFSLIFVYHSKFVAGDKLLDVFIHDVACC